MHILKFYYILSKLSVRDSTNHQGICSQGNSLTSTKSEKLICFANCDRISYKLTRLSHEVFLKKVTILNFFRFYQIFIILIFGVKFYNWGKQNREMGI